nr:PREDICTED: uncharacterized protein LOC100558308 [Anolis carolinensis]|eukprot:XP_008120161.2 PREDICTED: uncharacterized protein LOC100558308 [Anolis carolinensis]
MAFRQDEMYNTFIISEEVQSALQKILALAELLLLANSPIEEISNKSSGLVDSASYFFTIAKDKILISHPNEVIVLIKQMQDNLQEKKGKLADMRVEIIAHKEAQMKAETMPESAELCLKKERKQHEKHAEEETCKMPANMLAPFSILRLVMSSSLKAVVDAAYKLVVETEQALAQYRVEVEGYKEEVAEIPRKEQELLAWINTMEQEISQVQSECDEVLALYATRTTQASWIRKCLSQLNFLGGKIKAAAVICNYGDISEFVVDILEEIAGMISGQDAESFLVDKEIRTLVKQINSAVQSLRARANVAIA